MEEISSLAFLEIVKLLSFTNAFSIDVEESSRERKKGNLEKERQYLSPLSLSKERGKKKTLIYVGFRSARAALEWLLDQLLCL